MIKLKNLLFLNSVNSDKDQKDESPVGYGLKMFNLKVSNLAYGKKVKYIDKNLEETVRNKLELTPIWQLNNMYKHCFFAEERWIRSLESVRKLKIVLKNYINNESQDQNKKTFDDKKYVVLPLTLSFTIDGISGLKHYNMVDIDYKPDRYIDNVFFHISNISHKITQNDWTTEINTIMRINNLENTK